VRRHACEGRHAAFFFLEINMTATKTLKAEARDRAGKGAARALRREHKIPAVIYGAKQSPVGIALDPVKGHLIHIDFLRVSKDSVVTVTVPVHTINEDKAPGLKDGGVLNLAHTVELSVSAENIPEALEVDLSGLGIGDAVHISQVKLPNGAKPTHHEDFTVASVSAPAADEAADEAGDEATVADAAASDAE
jgi:large subunit ribosomal protein L25